MPEILARQPNARCVIAGDPFPRPQDVAYRERLLALISDLGLEDSVIVAGHVEDVGAVYAAANVYSLDERLFEHLGRLAPSRQALPRGVFLAAALATAMLPLVVLAWGFWSRRTFVLDTQAPVVRILSAELRSGRTTVRFSLNELALVTVGFGDRVVETERSAGVHTIRRRVRAERVGLKAVDAAENIGRDRARTT